jgi:hypothetical protein
MAVMSFKESLENNAVWYASGIAITAFVAGLGAKAVVFPDTPKSPDSSISEWKEEATKSGWVPQSGCPAYPVSATITSSGDGTVVSVSNSSSESSIVADLVVQTSRPIPKGSSVGYIINQDGTTNFYMLFPYFKTSDDNTIFRDDKFINVPFVIKSGSTINMWAAIVDNAQHFGSVYASIEQIKKSGSDVMVSPKVSMKTEEK